MTNIDIMVPAILPNFKAMRMDLNLRSTTPIPASTAQRPPRFFWGCGDWNEVGIFGSKAEVGLLKPECSSDMI
jgi:hypothetical protein